MKNLLLFIIVILSAVIVISPVFADIMSSPSYRIQSDSVNIGGERQTSTSYHLEDTIGEIATGLSTSTSYKLKAGYQQMQEVYIAVSAPAEVAMSPDIGGLTGGTSNGSSTITVTTDSPSGYVASVKADSSPALATSSYSFADYAPSSTSTPDYIWLIAATTSEFGFTPEGAHIVQKYKDNESVCATGTQDTVNKCWYSFSTSDETITQSYSANHPSGTETILKLRAESGSSHLQVAGEYKATIIITALAN